MDRGFDLQPTLAGELLRVRPLEPRDFGALYAVASDPLLWEQHFDPERWREARFRQFFEQAIGSRGALVVHDATSGEVIGSSRYRWMEESQPEMEIGWTFLARSHWGGRYNGELKGLMLGHAFHFVDHVVFLVTPNNLRSRRALKKIGATADGIVRTAGGRDALRFVVRRSAR